jgi:hypothetical protein
VNRSQLAHIVRAASRIVDAEGMLILGSQSILGAFEEYQLPDVATLSREADIAFFDDPDERKSDLVDGAIGEMSTFDDTFGIYAQGVSVSTAVLPAGWRERVIAFQSSETEGVVAWCLEPHDLCLSKLVANREKDLAFVAALLDEGLISIEVLRRRATELPLPGTTLRVTTRWLTGWTPTPR